MKKNTIVHEQMLISALNTIGKAGMTSMSQLHQVSTLEEMFLAALTPWLEDQLQESSCAALLQAGSIDAESALEAVLAALLNRIASYGSCAPAPCRMDLMLRQACHGPRAALQLMHHTVHHICLDMVRAQRRAG